MQSRETSSMFKQQLTTLRKKDLKYVPKNLIEVRVKKNKDRQDAAENDVMWIADLTGQTYLELRRNRFETKIHRTQGR